MNREFVVNFVTSTYHLSDREFKKLLEQLIELRLITQLLRSNKNTYKDLKQAFKEHDTI